MKQLLLVRHAKSDWANAGLADFDRPLNTRGHSSAPEMAQRMLTKGLVPEFIVSSPALRAITTANYLLTAWNIPVENLSTHPGIYEAPASRLLGIVNKFNNDFDFIALVGHNPGLSYLLENLTGSELYDLPTCAMALIEFPVDDWKLISSGTGELKLLDYPKNQ